MDLTLALSTVVFVKTSSSLLRSISFRNIPSSLLQFNMFLLFYVEQSIPKSFKYISFITIYINFSLKFIHLIICL